MSTLNVSNITDGTDTVETGYVVNGSAKAWVNFNGTGTIAIRDSLNVASLTDNGTGDYIINLSNAMANAHYAPTAGSDTDPSYSVQRTSIFVSATSNSTVTPTTTAYHVSTREASGAARDETYVLSSTHGDLA